MNRLMKDLEVDRAKNPEAAAHDTWDQEEDDDDDDLDVNIIDRSAFLFFISYITLMGGCFVFIRRTTVAGSIY